MLSARVLKIESWLRYVGIFYRFTEVKYINTWAIPIYFFFFSQKKFFCRLFFQNSVERRLPPFTKHSTFKLTAVSILSVLYMRWSVIFVHSSRIQIPPKTPTSPRRAHLLTPVASEQTHFTFEEIEYWIRCRHFWKREKLAAVAFQSQAHRLARKRALKRKLLLRGWKNSKFLLRMRLNFFSFWFVDANRQLIREFSVDRKKLTT